MTYDKIKTDAKYLEIYSCFLKLCFPHSSNKFNIEYLNWLYNSNPNGIVVGYNAFDNGKLVAHYACVPVNIIINGHFHRGLISLNSATHPNYQGKGYFLELANKTYSEAGSLGFDCVYGVSNSNSTHAFINKLGFRLVSPLDVHFNIDFNFLPIHEIIQFQINWTEPDLLWRLKNPNGKYEIISQVNKQQICISNTNFSLIKLISPIRGNLLKSSDSFSRFNLKCFIGLIPTQKNIFPNINLPSFLRPSPLNFIVKPLNPKLDLSLINKNNCILTFLDFDAF